MDRNRIGFLAFALATTFATSFAVNTANAWDPGGSSIHIQPRSYSPPLEPKYDPGPKKVKLKGAIKQTVRGPKPQTGGISQNGGGTPQTPKSDSTGGPVVIPTTITVDNGSGVIGTPIPKTPQTKTAVINGYTVTYNTYDGIDDPPTTPDPIGDAVLVGGVTAIGKLTVSAATATVGGIAKALGPTVQVNTVQRTIHTATSPYFNNAFRNPNNWTSMPQNLAKILFPGFKTVN